MAVKIVLENGKSFFFNDSELLSCTYVKNNRVITVKHFLDNIPCICTYFFDTDLIAYYSEVEDYESDIYELTDDLYLPY